jgi:hypothetical protein
MVSSPLPLLHPSVAVLFPFLCDLSGKLPYCHSVDWDSILVHSWTGTPFSTARESVRLALHVDSFDADSVRALCMPWLLDPFSFLQGCSRSGRDAVCSAIAAFVLLIGASVADDAVPAGSCVFASGLVRRSLSALALQPVSRVAGRCPVSFRPARGAEAEAPLG